MKDLKQKSVDAVIWNLLEKFGIQFTKMILGVILARLLTPADYGLIGMITVFFVIANVFIDSGFGLAYIQKKDVSKTDASTIFYFNLFVSCIFFGLLWIFAPLIADFYGQEDLIELIRVMSLILILNSFGIMQIAKLTKEVNFSKKTIITLTSAILSGGAGITAALLNFGVWSLVVQGLTNAFIKNVGLWFMYRWRPLFTFNLESLKSLFSFSSWALLTNIFYTIFDNLYILVIGKYFPAAQLGFYTKASQFQLMVSKQSSQAIGSVAFPVFSMIQDEKERLKKAMRNFNQHALFFIAPISAILIVIAEPLILLVLTEKWLPMVPYFQLLLISGFLYPLHMVNVQVLSAQGKVNLTFRIELIKNSLRVINIVIMYRYGVFYIILGEIVLSFIALIINTYYSKRFINYGILEQLKDLFVILIISAMMAILGLVLLNNLENPYFKIIMGVISLGIFYIGNMYVFNRSMVLSLKGIIKHKLSKK